MRYKLLVPGILAISAMFIPMGSSELTMKKIDLANGLERGTDGGCHGSLSVSYSPFPQDSLYLISVTTNPVDCSVTVATADRAAPSDFASTRNITIVGSLEEKTGDTLTLAGTYAFIPNNCPTAPQPILATFAPLPGRSAWAPQSVPPDQTFSSCWTLFSQSWTLPATTSHSIQTHLGGYSTATWGCDFGILPGGLSPSSMVCTEGTV